MLPASPSRFPILERFWQGEPNVIMWTGGIFPPSTLVISPKCVILGKWRLVMAIGDFSISLAQMGMIPLREAARGNTPIPSNRLPNLRAHINRLSPCFIRCVHVLSAPFRAIKKHHLWKSIQWCFFLSADFSRISSSPIEKDANLKNAPFSIFLFSFYKSTVCLLSAKP